MLIRKLLAGTRLEDALEKPLSELLVGDMSDGGMWSIQFRYPDPRDFKIADPGQNPSVKRKRERRHA